MEKTPEYVKSVFEKWSKKDSNIPKNLLKHLHINTIEEKTNYLFTHDLSSIYNIEREMKNEGDGFKFEDGEVNSDNFDYEKPAKGDWLKQDELIPFKRFRTTAEAIKSSIKTLDCEETETCPKCDGDKKYECSSCDGTAKLECGTCSGNGACYTCDGDKKLRCSNCSGTGKVTDFSFGAALSSDKRRKAVKSVRCTECRAGKVTCYRCSGQGKCQNCRGKGQLKCEATGCNRGIVDCTRCEKTGIITCTTCKGLGKYQEFKVYYQDYINSCYPSFFLEEFAESNASNLSKEKFITKNVELIKFKDESSKVIIDRSNINEKLMLEKSFTKSDAINTHLTKNIQQNISNIKSIPFYEMTRSEYMNSGLLEDWGVDKVKECINPETEREICDYKIDCLSFKTLNIDFEYKGGDQTCSIFEYDGDKPIVFYEGKLRAPQLTQYKFSILRYITGPFKGWFYNSKKLKLYTMTAAKMIWADDELHSSEEDMYNKFIMNAKIRHSVKNECKRFILSEPEDIDIESCSKKVYQADKLNALVFAWHIVISDGDIHGKELEIFNNISKLFKVDDKTKEEIKKRAENNCRLYESKTFMQHGKLYWKRINPILFLSKLSFSIIFWGIILGIIWNEARPLIEEYLGKSEMINNILGRFF